MTGLDRDQDRVIELGVIVWDTLAKQPVRMMSAFLHDESTPEITEDILSRTGITETVLQKYGMPYKGVFERLGSLAEKCEIICAHNGVECDFVFWEKECKRQGLIFPEKFRMDTMLDIPYPPRITTRKLVHLAAEHGFLNPFPHRAVFDVMTMLQILSCYNIADVIMSSTLPIIKVRAHVEYDDRDLAKRAGYVWDGESKIWWKLVREDMYAIEVKSWTFRVEFLEENKPRNSILKVP